MPTVKTTKTMARPAAKHGGKTKLKRIAWQFNRLRNQVVKFYAGKDRELAHTLRVDLESARQWTDVRAVAIKRWHTSAKEWDACMNQFTAATVNKHLSV